MSASGPQSSRAVQRSTTENTTVSDSFNKTINQVRNFSFQDIGNTKIGTDALLAGSFQGNGNGGGGGVITSSATDPIVWSKSINYIILGGLVLVAAFMYRKG